MCVRIGVCGGCVWPWRDADESSRWKPEAFYRQVLGLKAGASGGQRRAVAGRPLLPGGSVRGGRVRRRADDHASALLLRSASPG